MDKHDVQNKTLVLKVLYYQEKNLTHGVRAEGRFVLGLSACGRLSVGCVAQKSNIYDALVVGFKYLLKVDEKLKEKLEDDKPLAELEPKPVKPTTRRPPTTRKHLKPKITAGSIEIESPIESSIEMY